ncbi:MAG: hypothetical protein GTN76_15685, partial [Candidatus Aenigmarchaeota archaeon]|nr:hypothetical protein [Candidatus Aenigmarchaeota archaeon]
MDMYAKKHASQALELAKNEKDQGRKSELHKITDICKRVPYEPARTFYEALQSFWFIQYILHIEGTGPTITPGRFDQ